MTYIVLLSYLLMFKLLQQIANLWIYVFKINRNYVLGSIFLIIANDMIRLQLKLILRAIRSSSVPVQK